MALQKRGYLPRSTIDYTAQRAVYEIADKNSLSFGKALEKLLLESITFKSSLEKLAKGSEWFKKDIDEFMEHQI